MPPKANAFSRAFSPRARARLLEIYAKLSRRFGERHWWPGDNPFEVAVGAVLTQNAAWRNVEKAIANLKARGLVTPEAIAEAPLGELLEALRPSGYYNVKARRLLSLCAFFLKNGEGGLYPSVLGWPLAKLRPALLEVPGVGPETADCVVLYAARQPSFVVDAYTKRILSRHGLANGEESYEETRAWFELNLPRQTQLYNEFHALFVAAGHYYCSPRKPKCELCPLGDDPRRAPDLI
jgi:endonuclease-3 related protein